MSETGKRIRGYFAATALLLAGSTFPVGAEPQREEGTRAAAEPTETAPTQDAKEMPVQQGRSGGTDPGLDALLRLPTGYVGERAPSVAGASEAEWRRRFRKTHEALTEARENLEKTKRELDGVAQTGGSTQWSVAAPTGGGGGEPNQSTSPLSFKLRGALKRNRIELDRAEKSMRELNIEADLAGVPKSWRGDTEATHTPSEVGQLLD